jgi:hypothetical protein
MHRASRSISNSECVLIMLLPLSETWIPPSSQQRGDYVLHLLLKSKRGANGITSSEKLGLPDILLRISVESQAVLLQAVGERGLK